MSQVLEELALGIAEFRGDGDLHDDELIAAAVAAQMRDAQPAQANHRVRLRPRLHGDVAGAFQRGDGNDRPQGRLRDLLGRVKVVLFCPDDLALVKGAASVRRKLLDMELSRLSPPYLFALQQYRQALRQRNELLRRGEPEGALLDVWDVQLITHGRALMEARAAYIAELSELAAEMYRRIAEAEPLEAAYICLLYTSDAADALLRVALGGRRIIKKKQTHTR